MQMNLRSVEEEMMDITPYAALAPYSDSDVWVAQNTVVTKDAWNDALRRYEDTHKISFRDLMSRIFPDTNSYSLEPRGNVQYFVKPQCSGRHQFISLYDEWLHYHEEVDLDRLHDPKYLQLLKETTLEQISDGFDDRRDMGLWSRWDDDHKAESCYWDFKHPVYFTRRLERSSLGDDGGD